MAFEGLSGKLKNIGKKGAGDAAGSDGGKKPSGVGEFFRKNPFVKYMIPVLVVVIIALVFLYITLGDGILSDDYSQSTTGAPSGETETVRVVPAGENIQDSDKAKELYELIDKDPLSEDILVKAEYKGCVIGTSGMRTAVVVNSGVSYTLKVGDTLSKSQWKVKEITESQITFTSGTNTKVITIK